VRLAAAAALALLLSGCAVLDNMRANTLDIAATGASGDRAIRMQREALAITERLYGQDSRMTGSRLSNLARSYESNGDYATARELYARAVATYERAAPTFYFFPAALSDYADLLRKLGEYSAARPLLERAVALREADYGARDPFIVPEIVQLAHLLQEMGDHASARPLYERAVRLSDRFGLEYMHAHRLTELADLLLDMGDRPGARALYERARRINEAGIYHSTWLWKIRFAPQPWLPVNFAFFLYWYGPNRAANLHGTARLLEAEGDDRGARELYARVLERREPWGATHPQVAFHLIALARVEARLGEGAAARARYERALQILRAVHVPEWHWQAAHGLGAVAEREGRLPEALELYREAVRTLQSLSAQFADGTTRTRFLDVGGRAAPYDALAALLLRLHETTPGAGHAAEAAAVLEAKKTRIVGQVLASLERPPSDPAALAEAQRVRGKQEEVLGLEAALREEQARSAGHPTGLAQAVTERLARTKAEYAQQVQEFLARHPRYKAQFVDQHTIDPRLLTKLAGRLAPNTMALQYFAAPDRLYAFVVTSDGRFSVRSRTVPQAEVYRLVRAYRAALERAATRRLPWEDDGSDDYRRDVAPLRALTRELSLHLLAPVEGELALYPHVVLIPNDLLLYLPIHALTRDGTDGRTRFLAETHVVSYVTQLELMDLVHRPRVGADIPLLAFGNPDGTLPAARDELRALRTMRRSVMVLEGAEATKPRFLELADQFSDFHFATHGVLDPGRPERSYLLMAGDDEASQHLALREIAGLNLKPNGIVILSACDTAVGEQVPGAALMTFAAAFSQAGAESIIASLWKVNDRAARDVMVAFHRGLQTTDRATALRQAQVALLRDPRTTHPYYWAPFILLGGR
jgi:CHAT domain-containing protein